MSERARGRAPRPGRGNPEDARGAGGPRKGAGPPGGRKAAGPPTGRAGGSQRPQQRGPGRGRGGDAQDAWSGDVVYGRNAVRELLRAGRRPVHAIHATQRAMREPWLAGHRVAEAPPAALTDLCGSPDHQGICAYADPYPYADDAALLAATRPLILALDEVTDPHNLGALARTAECAGATGLVIPQRRSAEVTAAACKASAGAVEHLPVARVVNMADFLARAKVEGCWIYGADGDAPASYRQQDYGGDGVVLVLGAEGKGLRPRVAAACDVLVSLPLQGRIESLNVSAAGAVLLYEILHRRLDSAP